MSLQAEVFQNEVYLIDSKPHDCAQVRSSAIMLGLHRQQWIKRADLRRVRKDTSPGDQFVPSHYNSKATGWIMITHGLVQLQLRPWDAFMKLVCKVQREMVSILYNTFNQYMEVFGTNHNLVDYYSNHLPHNPITHQFAIVDINNKTRLYLNYYGSNRATPEVGAHFLLGQHLSNFPTQ